jgi:hypothetical protein
MLLSCAFSSRLPHRSLLRLRIKSSLPKHPLARAPPRIDVPPSSPIHPSSLVRSLRRSTPTLAHTSAPAPAPAAATRTPPVISETLRPIHLPANVLADFYAFAAANIDVETCGLPLRSIRCDDASPRWITHVIIPNQTATADTCCTTDEEQLIALQIHHDLLTLGWASVPYRARDSDVIALYT